MIPLHLSGAVIAGMFVLLACVALAITWALCVIADDWREAEWMAERDDGEYLK